MQALFVHLYNVSLYRAILQAKVTHEKSHRCANYWKACTNCTYEQNTMHFCHLICFPDLSLLLLYYLLFQSLLLRKIRAK